jgi:hypothetical protein
VMDSTAGDPPEAGPLYLRLGGQQLAARAQGPARHRSRRRGRPAARISGHSGHEGKRSSR